MAKKGKNLEQFDDEYFKIARIQLVFDHGNLIDLLTKRGQAMLSDNDIARSAASGILIDPEKNNEAVNNYIRSTKGMKEVCRILSAYIIFEKEEGAHYAYRCFSRNITE